MEYLPKIHAPHLSTCVNYEHFILIIIIINLIINRSSSLEGSEIYTAESQTPKPIPKRLELVIENKKKIKAPGVDKIPFELIQAGGGKLCEDIHKLFVLIWNKEKLQHEYNLKKPHNASTFLSLLRQFPIFFASSLIVYTSNYNSSSSFLPSLFSH